MNRITEHIQNRHGRILNVYFTAGYPNLNDTATIAKYLDEAGADLIEIGIPFSDPVADGPVIQAANQDALENGMTLKLLLEQVREMRSSIQIPIILMGYFNQVMQYGIPEFAADCAKSGVDGLILPDLPAEVYQRQFQEIFEGHGISVVFLVTPQTSDARIKTLAALSKGFLYALSSASITGKAGLEDTQEAWFRRLANLNLDIPVLIGFGVSTNADFEKVNQYVSGAIVGSAFLRHIDANGISSESIQHFVNSLISQPQKSKLQ